MSLVDGGLFHDMKSMPQAMSASSCCRSLIRSPTQKNTTLMNTKRSATQAGMLKSGICRCNKSPLMHWLLASHCHTLTAPSALQSLRCLRQVILNHARRRADWFMFMLFALLSLWHQTKDHLLHGSAGKVAHLRQKVNPVHAFCSLHAPCKHMTISAISLCSACIAF